LKTFFFFSVLFRAVGEGQADQRGNVEHSANINIKVKHVY